MSQNNSEGVRKPVLYIAALLVAVVAGAVVFKKLKSTPGEPPPAQEAAAPATTTADTPAKPMRTDREPDVAQSEPAPRPVVPAPRKPVTPPPATPPPQVPASPEMRSLVSALANIDLKSTPLTAEAAAAWRQSLAQLAQSGPAAVPAIREFLELNRDVNFDQAPGGTALLGSPSLRLSLLEALGAINAPEALALAATTLQSSTDPREIALLARNLEQQAPEQYREAALAAARAAMAEASAGRLANKDVGPLFDVLRSFGGANAVRDFQQAATGPWKYYATIALADLPEGAGVPALVEMISDSKNASMGGRVAAMQALAQLVPDHAEARNLMLEQARQGTIQPATWINIAASLAGDKFQIGTPPGDHNPNTRTWRLTYGNQSYYAMPGPLTPEQIQQRIGLVDQFLALNNNNAIAQTALQDARNKLLARQAPPQQ